MRTYRYRALGSDRHRGRSGVAEWGTTGLIVGIIACGPSGPDKVPSPPAAPSSPTAPSPPPPPSADDGKPTLSGTAYEHTASGTRPLGGVLLRVTGSAGETLDVVTDARGQYQVTLEREYAMVAARLQREYLSPCSAQLHLWSSPLDVHFVSRTNLLATGTPASMPPFVSPNGYRFVVVLSGFVTERTAEGRRPVVEASVEHFYGDGQSGDPTGFTLTNADGYYVLCGYWNDFGQSIRVQKDGYRSSLQAWQSSERIDFELTPE